MPIPDTMLYFANAAGEVAAHPAGYAVLRYQPGKRQPADLPELFTELGQLLLGRGWTKFLADNRAMTPLTATEKVWFVDQWLGRRVARPVGLLGSLVLPHEVVARLSMLEMFALANKDNISYATFVDLAPAEAHLTNLELGRPSRRPRQALAGK